MNKDSSCLNLSSNSKKVSEKDFNDAKLCKSLCKVLEQELSSELKFMEVCGTHTVSIFRSGLRDILPSSITHLSGPGCPVCVTSDVDISKCLELSEKEDVIIATFGDMLRIPSSDGRTLKSARANGARVSIVYSPLDALLLAKKNLDKKVVFLGVGFETTAPILAATILAAKEQNVSNFYVMPMAKQVPPALESLLKDEDGLKNIDAFLLPGHVATIIGLEPFKFLASSYKVPAVVAGFTAADILQSLIMLVRMQNKNQPNVLNQYIRSVDSNGNLKAIKLLEQVFEPSDAYWRGIGVISNSGFAIKKEFENMDAGNVFSFKTKLLESKTACQCGNVLRGKISPPSCSLFANKCTPANPMGPCMVSTEGSCAAYYAYQLSN